MSTTEKDFHPIQSDYEFFVAHATEAEADLAAYLDWLQELGLLGGRDGGSGRLQTLDFGSGPGTFTEQFLTRAGWPPEQVELTLVEPVEDYRRAALARLQGGRSVSVRAQPRLPDDQVGVFDLALSNHALYYVPALQAELARIVRALRPDGVFLAAVAGRDNALIEVWSRAFAWLGRPTPYHTAEDVETALRTLGSSFQRKAVAYTLAFPDTAADREKILRFLLGEYLALIPAATALSFLDPHVVGGRVQVHTSHFQYAVRPR